MALNPNVPVVAPGELITATHMNAVRSNLDRLDTTKLSTTGGTFTGTLQGSTFIATSQIRAGAEPSTGAGFSVLGTNGRITASVTGAGGTTPTEPNAIFGRGGGAAAVNAWFLQFRSDATSSATPLTNINGGVQMTGTTTCAFVGTSDRRLKDVIGPIDDPLGLIGALRPIRFRWKNDPDVVEQAGFLADEVADVAPYAVWGEPDAVLPADDPYNPGGIDPQQLDASKLVPMLVAAVQALAARVAILEGAGT